MTTLYCLSHTFAYEMECTVRLFFPGIKLQVCTQSQEQGHQDTILTAMKPSEGAVHLSASACIQGRNASRSGAFLNNLDTLRLERELALLLYAVLEEITGIRPPWGILTGVRPVRLCRQWEREGLTSEQIHNRLTNDYLVLPQKADLTLATGKAQQQVLAANTPESFSLYISIPFCPTRCLYCSFVSAAMDKMQALVPDYVTLLCEEIAATARIAKEKGMQLKTVYMGGGTPTTLDPKQLHTVLQAVAKHFDLSGLKEYTVEAGRPDTITRAKLAVLREFGIDRISINPQTMDDTILKTIGRRHTAAQVVESFHLAREMGFSAINMDLIAGLPGETQNSFSHTLKEVLFLRPENLTLHTLTVKRSSTLREQDDAFSGSALALDALLWEAQSRFDEAGYFPYYLYRQKGTVQNLENTGFTLPGYTGIYNIYSMEESHTILAVGAGAVTKLCRGDTDIQRIFNFKYPSEYISRFTEILDRKTAVQEWNI